LRTLFDWAAFSAGSYVSFAPSIPSQGTIERQPPPIRARLVIQSEGASSEPAAPSSVRGVRHGRVGERGLRARSAEHVPHTRITLLARSNPLHPHALHVFFEAGTRGGSVSMRARLPPQRRTAAPLATPPCLATSARARHRQQASGPMLRALPARRCGSHRVLRRLGVRLRARPRASHPAQATPWGGLTPRAMRAGH
jgi:hypothetical protein